MMKKGFLTGLLLFGIFFGAGNLIFPPALGAASGQSFWPAIIGFCLSGVGLAVVTLLTGLFTNGGFRQDMDKKFGSWFSVGFLCLLYLTIGPLFAIPRTATVSFEIGIAPWVSESSLWLLGFSALFFLSAYYLAVRPSGILDSVGKILTPIFALMILTLVVVGAITYGNRGSAETQAIYQTGAFSQGILEGYNTLDALASVAFSLVALTTLKKFGFSSKKEYFMTVTVVGIVTTLAFSVLYIGLGFLGNHFPIPAEVLADASINKGAYILTEASYALFGHFGRLFLSVMVTLTCFTTTVGLIVSVSDFFSQTFKAASFKTYARAFTVIGFLIANLGLNAVITFSVPVLMLLYPIVIVLVLVMLLNKLLPLSKIGMQVTIGLTSLFSLLGVLAPYYPLLNNLLGKMPLASYSMAWVLPAALGLVLALLLSDKQQGDSFKLDAL